ncbi:MAG TPA: hypothetical protein VJU86_11270 [Pyrinomonadaceae bacterium]|nr:hypothetical protein [Pyrinomonadaceae bacterium]
MNPLSQGCQSATLGWNSRTLSALFVVPEFSQSLGSDRVDLPHKACGLSIMHVDLRGDFCNAANFRRFLPALVLRPTIIIAQESTVFSQEKRGSPQTR